MPPSSARLLTTGTTSSSICPMARSTAATLSASCAASAADALSMPRTSVERSPSESPSSPKAR
eukprot:6298732-Prymnesium_polylepis.1